MDAKEVRECKKYTRRHVRRFRVMVAGDIWMVRGKIYGVALLPGLSGSLARLPNFHNL